MSNSYVPPHKRETGEKVKRVKVKDPAPLSLDISFPKLVDAKPVEESKMDFSKLFKNVINSTKKKPMKKGLVLLTKTKVIDSLTADERLEEDEYWDNLRLQSYLSRFVQRLDKQKDERREFDPDYVSEGEFVESEEEEEVEETEEEEEEEDFVEDEFEDEI
jgi:hypothetical protein